MSVRDVGDGLPIEHRVYDPDTGDLVDATVALTVTDPSGDVTTPSPTHPSTGVYRHTITLSEEGLWRWKWTVTGTLTDVAYGDVVARDPAPPTYATLDALKRYMLGQEQAALDTVDDAELLDVLESASREIDNCCERRFYPDSSATPRLYGRDSILRGVAWVDDFHSTTGLVVATDDVDDGTYSTTWAATDYQLEPLNGVVDGEAGWPHYRIVPVTRRWPGWTRRAPLRVTARWGWASVPPPVRQACLILAAETHKLRAAPFGIASFGEFGAIRVRDNPMAARKLRKYMRDPAKVG